MHVSPSLETILQYKNPLVIKRFKRNFPNYADQAETLFEDMLMYLWLSYKHYLDDKHDPQNAQLAFNFVMHKEMRMIDEMWHCFILITLDYAAFCDKYFGKFMHHVPEVGNETEENKNVDLKKFENELRLFLSYTYDHLGEATVKKWFANYV